MHPQWIGGRVRNPRDNAKGVTFCNQTTWKEEEKFLNAFLMALVSASFDSLMPIGLKKTNRHSFLLIKRAPLVLLGLISLEWSCPHKTYRKPLPVETTLLICALSDLSSSCMHLNLEKCHPTNNLSILTLWAPTTHYLQSDSHNINQLLDISYIVIKNPAVYLLPNRAQNSYNYASLWGLPSILEGAMHPYKCCLPCQLREAPIDPKFHQKETQIFRG